MSSERDRVAYVASLSPEDRRLLLSAITERRRRQLETLGAEVLKNGGGHLRATELDALADALRNPRPMSEVGHRDRRPIDLVTTVGEAASALPVQSRTLVRWAESGTVRARKAGAIWLIELADVEHLAKERA